MIVRPIPPPLAGGGQGEGVAVARARDMRKNPTPAERLLWQAFRRKSFAGLKVRRQVPFGPYILDFYIPSVRVAIEVDGESHVESTSDVQRDIWLAAQSVRTLRFWNNEVASNLEGVLLTILADISPAAPPPPPNPLPQGEGEPCAAPPPLAGGGRGEG
jgi:very-short-patch-repair endonuclease